MENSPVAISAHAIRLKQELYKAEQDGVDFAIIDTPPNTNPFPMEVTKTAESLADLAIIPIKDSRFDVEAIAGTIQFGIDAKIPMRILFNAIKTRSADLKPAQEGVAEYGVPILPCVLHDRVSFSRSVLNGLGVHEYEKLHDKTRKYKGSKEVEALYAYIATEMEI